MDNRIIQLVKFLKGTYETFRKDMQTLLDLNTGKIVKSIENKQNAEDISINNPESITQPIVTAQNEVAMAVKAIPRVEIPPVDLTSLEVKIEALKTALENKEMSVNIGKTTVDVDMKAVVKAIDKLRDAMPGMVKQDVIDYTLMLDEMIGLMEKGQDRSELKKIEKALEKVANHEDIANIAEWLKSIRERPDPEFPKLKFDDKGNLLVTPTKGGGGGMGLTAIETGYLKDIAENTENITINAGDIEIGAVEIKNATDDTRATVGADGLYVVNRSGLFIPIHDTQVVDESLAPATTVITYKLNSATVATKTITVSGTTTTIAMTYV